MDDRKRALDSAKSALDLVGTEIREDTWGDLEGIDDVSMGLDAMALALVSYYELEEDEDTSLDTLHEVLARLETKRLAPEGIAVAVAALADEVRQLNYEPAGWREIDEKRKAVHEELNDLVSKMDDPEGT
jgi:hypothetical protein